MANSFSIERLEVAVLAFFFGHADHTPISVYQFNVAHQQCLFYCVLDHILDISRYKGHIFRIGGGYHAADTGYSDAQICALIVGKPTHLFKAYLRLEILQGN